MIEPLYQAERENGLQVYFVIFHDAAGDLPSAGHCALKREELGLSMPVLFDGAGVFQTLYGVDESDTSFVFARGGEIVARSHADNDGVVQLLHELLDAPDPDAGP